MKLYEIKKDLVEMLDLLTEVGDDELAKENCEEMLEFCKFCRMNLDEQCL